MKRQRHMDDENLRAQSKIQCHKKRRTDSDFFPATPLRLPPPLPQQGHLQGSTHPFLHRLISPMSLELFGFHPRVKQPDLSVEETLLLQDLTSLLAIVRKETQHWLYTSSKTTLKALAAADAIILSLTSALSADDHRIERLISVVKSKYSIFHSLSRLSRPLRPFCSILLPSFIDFVGLSPD